MLLVGGSMPFTERDIRGGGGMRDDWLGRLRWEQIEADLSALVTTVSIDVVDKDDDTEALLRELEVVE